MVRYVWQRHGLSTQSSRRAWAKLLEVQSKSRGSQVGLTEESKKALESDASHRLMALAQERPSVDG
jgi:hypothetical protein